MRRLASCKQIFTLAVDHRLGGADLGTAGLLGTFGDVFAAELALDDLRVEAIPLERGMWKGQAISQ